MEKVLKGIKAFQTEVFGTQRQLFSKLAKGQNPNVLFITCSDSRIDPNLITQTEPGEIFVLRNAGNIVPCFPTETGEIATIEFAIVGLGIKEIVILGHSDCGAVKGLKNPAALEKTMPTVYRWLHHAKRRTYGLEHEANTGHKHLMEDVQDNVMTQIENLRTHSFIEKRLDEGSLKLHGWVYDFETGTINGYDYVAKKFVPVKGDTVPRPVYPRPETKDSHSKVSGS